MMHRIGQYWPGDPLPPCGWARRAPTPAAYEPIVPRVGTAVAPQAYRARARTTVRGRQRCTKGHTAQQTSPTWSARPRGLAAQSRCTTGQSTRVGRGGRGAVVALVRPRDKGRDRRRSATRFSHRRSRATPRVCDMAGGCPGAQIRVSRIAVSIARSSKRTKTVPVRGVARALHTAGSASRVLTRRRSSASERSGRCTRRRPGSAWRIVAVAGARAGVVIGYLAISVTPGRPGMTKNV